MARIKAQALLRRSIFAAMMKSLSVLTVNFCESTM